MSSQDLESCPSSMLLPTYQYTKTCFTDIGSNLRSRWALKSSMAVMSLNMCTVHFTFSQVSTRHYNGRLKPFGHNSTNLMLYSSFDGENVTVWHLWELYHHHTRGNKPCTWNGKGYMSASVWLALAISASESCLWYICSAEVSDVWIQGEVDAGVGH